MRREADQKPMEVANSSFVILSALALNVSHGKRPSTMDCRRASEVARG